MLERVDELVVGLLCALSAGLLIRIHASRSFCLFSITWIRRLREALGGFPNAEGRRGPI